MAVLPKVIYRFNTIPIRIFHRTRTNDPKIFIESQKILNCQRNLQKNEQSWRYNPLSLWAVLQSYNSQNSNGIGKKTDSKINGKEKSQEINMFIFSLLTYIKVGKNIEWKSDNLFNKWCWKTRKSHEQSPNIDIRTFPCILLKKIYSKLFEDLNVRHEIAKLLEGWNTLWYKS